MEMPITVLKYFSSVIGTVGIGTEYWYRDTFFIKYRGTRSNSRVIESFLQALRHAFVFRIDRSFKGFS